MIDLWKKAQKGVGHLINDFMSSVATNLLQFQKFIYAQPTYVWTEILYSSAFRKLIVENWHCLYCALIARVSKGLNLGMLFSMPPRVRLSTTEIPVVHLSNRGHWHHLKSNHTQAPTDPAFLQDRWCQCQGSSWVNELDLGLTDSVGLFTPRIGEYLSL